MAFIVGKKLGMTQIFRDDGTVIPVTVVSADAGDLKEGDIVKVTGTSKSKGFQGAVKRHGFHGMPASHGHHHVLRHVGSIGQRFPQHTLKGMRMAGRMGGKKTTTRGLKVIVVDSEKHFLALKGAVPGQRGGTLKLETLKP